MWRESNAGKRHYTNFYSFTNWRRQIVCHSWVPRPQLFRRRNNTEAKPWWLIESPFGLLNATQKDKQITYNHNTIVWGEMTSNTSRSVTIFSGRAYLELTQTDVDNEISRLVDTQREVVISFYNTPDRSNSELTSAFKVVGMPKTFLLFSAKTTSELYRIYRNIFILCNDTKRPILSCARKH